MGVLLGDVRALTAVGRPIAVIPDWVYRTGAIFALSGGLAMCTSAAAYYRVSHHSMSFQWSNLKKGTCPNCGEHNLIDTKEGGRAKCCADTEHCGFWVERGLFERIQSNLDYLSRPLLPGDSVELYRLMRRAEHGEVISEFEGYMYLEPVKE